ncbi:hypothetical protein RRG08_066221 [Elysia crispata]|uniref:Uncharacterized protein n=1 Tax=Elysia crispata TaxID=231223 RepID=A0AAE1EEP2_9GAST|nr:hypothetical protein RRG08_066221 [Elysia crispata]
MENQENLELKDSERKRKQLHYPTETPLIPSSGNLGRSQRRESLSTRPPALQFFQQLKFLKSSKWLVALPFQEDGVDSCIVGSDERRAASILWTRGLVKRPSPRTGHQERETDDTKENLG